MYENIRNIASWYPLEVRDRYITAAANFRIPYWDWAIVPPSGQSVFPDSVGESPGISVDGPSGTQVIANPLYSYRFKPLDTSMLPDSPAS
jgi:tyrosinase